MADYTFDDDFVDIEYEVSERFIYNDVRSQTGTSSVETVVDEDPTYEWHVWTKFSGLPAPGYTSFHYFTAEVEPKAWDFEISGVYSTDGPPYEEYNDWEADLISTNEERTKALEITNTGDEYATCKIEVKYKYLASEAITHQETTYSTLTVRAIDSPSIQKYGRRVMNLKWPHGESQTAMQSLVDQKLEQYKDPHDRVTITIMGDTDARKAKIFGIELSDTMQVKCSEISLDDDFWVERIEMDVNRDQIPVVTIEGQQLSAAEKTDKFSLDGDSTLDGTSTLGA